MRFWKQGLPVLLLTLVGAWALHGRWGEVGMLGQTLRTGKWGWVVIALALQTLAILNQPSLYQSLYEMLGLHIRWREIAPIVWAGHFVNVATPSAGLGGAALLMADGKRRGFPTSLLALANTLYFGFNFVWFAILLAFGLWALRARGELKPFEVAAATTLFAVLSSVLLGLIASPLWLGLLENFLTTIARFLNRVARPIAKRDIWPLESARYVALEAREAMAALSGAKGRLGRPIFHTFWVDALGIGVLGACIQAFPGAGNIGFASLVAAYAIATLFLIVSVTPQGLGVVEGVLGALLVSFGVPIGRAALIVVAFRGLSFWLPLAWGFAASRFAFSNFTEQEARDQKQEARNENWGGKYMKEEARDQKQEAREVVDIPAKVPRATVYSPLESVAETEAGASVAHAGANGLEGDEHHDVAPLLSPAPSLAKARANRWRSQVGVGLPALFVALMGCVNLYSAATPGLRQRVELIRDLPYHVGRESHLATTLAGFALLLIAQGLWRRKLASWGLALGVLIFSVFTHLLEGLDYEEATLALLLALWLWQTRRQFFARSDAPSIRRGVSTLLLAFGFTLVYGAVGFYFLDEYFRVHYDVRAAIAQTVAMFTSFSNPGLEPTRGFGAWFGNSIYLVAAATIGYALVSLLRPVVTRPSVAPEIRTRAEEIVETQGDTAFAFCALMDDKTYWFSAGGSVVAYAVVGRVAVAMGDPLGPRSDRAEAIRGFADFARRQDWRPAFYEIYEDALTHHRAAGLQTLRIAHDAVVDLKSWTMLGGPNKSLRSVVNTIKNKGYKAVAFEAPLSDEILELLRDVSHEWLAARGGSEKTFSLGAFEDDYVRGNPAMVIFDENERVMAFANIVSCYQAPELSIDLMRRRAEARSGAMELLFTSLFEWAKGKGYERFNIGPSPFAMVGEHSEDPATEKAIHFIYQHIDQFYNFKGLHAFKEKFKPRWRPLFLSYEGAAGLPLVAAAIVRADSGENSWWAFLRGLRGEKG